MKTCCKVGDNTPLPKKDLELTEPDEKLASGVQESAFRTVNSAGAEKQGDSMTMSIHRHQGCDL